MARPKKGSKDIRCCIQIPTDTYTLLEALQVELDSDTKGEVIRRAIQEMAISRGILLNKKRGTKQ